MTSLNNTHEPTILSPAERNTLNMADCVCGALFGPTMPKTPQQAVVALQHIINRFEGEPDVIFTAAVAIADIATEAAENGTIVDPLAGSDFESPAPNPETITGFDYTNQAWVQNGRYLRCGHPTEMECDCFGRTHQGERPSRAVLNEMMAEEQANAR
jgi:hypothetical protein